jgi:hypothetical protein
MQAQCCAQLKACDSGTACGTLAGCIAACKQGDSTCVNGCETADSSGVNDLQALVTCFDTNCKTTPACGTAVCDSGIVVADPGCGACLTTSCCDSWKQCAQDMTCAMCLTTTPTPASCSASSLYTAANMCQGQSCAMQCAATICDSGLGTASPACNYCLGQSCCFQADACKGDTTCLDCLTMSNGAGPGCATSSTYQALDGCWKSNCKTACGG